MLNLWVIELITIPIWPHLFQVVPFEPTGWRSCHAAWKTLSSIANGYDENLISRAAGVCIKESRKLVLVQERLLYLRFISEYAKVVWNRGCNITCYAGFYHKPKTIEDLADHLVGKVLDQFAIEHDIFKRWGGEASTVIVENIFDTKSRIIYSIVNPCNWYSWTADHLISIIGAQCCGYTNGEEWWRIREIMLRESQSIRVRWCSVFAILN